MTRRGRAFAGVVIETISSSPSSANPNRTALSGVGYMLMARARRLAPGSGALKRRDRERLRLTFGEVAERYDRVRPARPAQRFGDLAELARIGPSWASLIRAAAANSAVAAAARSRSAILPSFRIARAR